MIQAKRVKTSFVALFPGKPREDPSKTSINAPFEEDQVRKVVHLLGTKEFDPVLWKEVVAFPKYQELKEFIHSSYGGNYQRGSKLRELLMSHSKVTSTGVELASELLKVDPNKRRTAAEALSHNYLSSETPRPGLNAFESAK